jgi:23S rRNA (uridine2552-2'-O)-methyltransferase
MARTKSSRRWLDRHFHDEYVKRAQRDGYRSRAVYKLLEIQERDRLLQPGQTVVDLGAAPGGWSQIANKIVGERGQVVALDILPMEPLEGIAIIEGDFREEAVLGELRGLLQGRPVDLVISDMAPNISGMSAVDQPKAIHLCELALDFAREALRPGGAMVIKVFQGEGFDAFLKEVRAAFGKVSARKPKASRPESREVYLVATDFKL